MNRRKFLKLAAGLAIGAGVYASFPRRLLSAPQSSVYWGAMIPGKTYGINPATGLAYGNAPWDLSTWDLFESHAGKKVSILHWGQSWYASASWPYGYCAFEPSLMSMVRSRGAIPLLDWSSRDQSAGGSLTQPNFSLSNIVNGVHDAFITKWAADAKAWGYPFFMRFDWEMNGSWFVWSEKVNGNSPGQFVAAWRHVHDIFSSVGANNVTWVWCPNIDSGTMIPMASLYPGDAYVDWTALDGYNKYSTWLAFNQVFAGAGITWLYNSYHELLSIAPSKPIMLAEVASLEAGDGGAKKAAWTSDALTVQIPANFPAIRAIVWFNWNADPSSSFVIESSSAAQSAFASGIASPVYAANDFTSLPLGTKIVPLNPVIATATLAATRTSTASPTKTKTPAPTSAATSISTNTTVPTATRTSTAMPSATITRTPTQSPTPTRRHGKTGP
jgi:hypothetical protein